MKNISLNFQFGSIDYLHGPDITTVGVYRRIFGLVFKLIYTE